MPSAALPPAKIGTNHHFKPFSGYKIDCCDLTCIEELE